MITVMHLPLTLLAFFLEIVDGAFGMGYGTALTPVLLLVGFEPSHVVPAVLISQLVGDFLAAFSHHKFKNVDLSFKGEAFRVALTLGSLGSLGTVVAVVIAMNIPKTYLSVYIGVLVAVMGVIVIVTRKKKIIFSQTRLVVLGFVAAFNKALSGGGYGPLISGGQILSGMDAKKAIGLTSLIEGITCIVAVILYLFSGETIDYLLAAYLSLGVTFSGPISAFFVRKIESETLKVSVGLLNIALGIITLSKVFA